VDGAIRTEDVGEDDKVHLGGVGGVITS
jgi:hypothetical protein